MNTVARTHDPVDGDIFKKIVQAIRLNGYIVLDDALPAAMLEALFQDLKSQDEDDFEQAGLCHDQRPRQNQRVRSDKFCAVDANTPVIRDYLNRVEALRERLNKELFLGLFDYECHYSFYPKGAFYKKRVDSFKGRSNRVLTTVLYLNPDWKQEYGGELLMYGEEDEMPFLQVSPTWGKLVVFMSEHFPYEVLKASKPRYSLTGWFRINTGKGVNTDSSQSIDEFDEAD